MPSASGMLNSPFLSSYAERQKEGAWEEKNVKDHRTSPWRMVAGVKIRG